MYFAMYLIFTTYIIGSVGSVQFIDNNKENLGLYYEAIDKIKFSKDNYRLAIYIDISNYERKFRDIHKTSLQNQAVCNNPKINVSSICHSFDTIIKHNLLEMDKLYSNLRNLKDRRQKRALINLMGQFNRFMWGNLDEDDLATITGGISNNTVGLHKVVNIQKKQLTILQSGLNNIRNITQVMQNNTFKLKQSIDEIISAQQIINYTMNNLYLEQTLSEHLSIFNLILSEFNLETHDLISAISSARQGQLHANVMDTNILIKQLRLIENNLPENRQLPITTENIVNVLDFITLVTLSINFVDNNLIYILDIPICDKTEFTLFSIKSIPMKILNNQFGYIKPTNNLVAISNSNDSFIPLTENDIRACNQNKVHTICQHPDTYPRKRTINCEDLIYLNPNTIPENCDIRHIFYSAPMFQKLITKSSWIYLTPNPIDITIICGLITYSHELKNVGIIEINGGCEIHTPNTILISRATKLKNIYLDFIPEFNTSLSNFNLHNKFIKIKDSPPIKSPKIISIKNNLDDLAQISKSLDSVIDEIDSSQKSINFEAMLDNHRYLVYVVAIIVIYLLIHFLINKIKKKLAKMCIKAQNNERIKFGTRRMNYGEREI